MATIAKIAVVLTANTARLQKGMKRGGKALKSFQKQVGKTTKSLASLPSLLAATGIGLFSKSLIQAASDAEETQSKFDAVFKEQAESAETFAKSFSNSIGRGRTEVKGFLASIQDTFVPLGFARREARKLSQQVVKLAVDLASFNNIADSEALERLQGALIGNHENVRQFGVIITEATLKQELFNMGVTGGTAAATNQEKALARLNLIIKGTSDAQGDAIRTADGFANSLKRMQGAMKDLQESGGQALLPWSTEVVQRTSDIFKLVDKISKVQPKVITIAPGFTFTAADVLELQKEIAEGERVRDTLLAERKEILKSDKLSGRQRKRFAELNDLVVSQISFLNLFKIDLEIYNTALKRDSELQAKKLNVIKAQEDAEKRTAESVKRRAEAIKAALPEFRRKGFDFFQGINTSITRTFAKLDDFIAGAKKEAARKLQEQDIDRIFERFLFPAAGLNPLQRALMEQAEVRANAKSGHSVGLGRFETVAGLRAMATDVFPDLLNESKKQTASLKSLDGKGPPVAVSAP